METSIETSPFKVKVKALLRPTVSQSVCLGVRHPPRAHFQIFNTVRDSVTLLQGVISDERTVCSLQSLVNFSSTVILWSEFRRTNI
jgi:hypothetical protein